MARCTSFHIILLAVTLLVTAQTSKASLLFPQVFLDSSQGPGQDIFTTQGAHFDPATGFWTVSARAVSITFDGVKIIPLVNGTVDLRGAFVRSSSEEGFVTGLFTTDGVPGPDIVVADNTGLLLAGTYGGRWITGAIGTGDGWSTSTFIVTGGSLAPFYAPFGGEGGMENILFDISPLFTADSFKIGFDGHISGSFGPIPEPATLVLLGSSLFARSLGRRRRRGQATGRVTCSCGCPADP